MKTWYRMTAEEALRGLESSRSGLSTRQAEARYTQYGENALQEYPGKKTWQVFLEQFQDLLVLILIAAAAISILSGSGESAVVIFAVITMNAVLGTIQHEKARKSLESLKKLLHRLPGYCGMDGSWKSRRRSWCREILCCWMQEVWWRQTDGCWSATIFR